jgi:hypothetical protein
MHTVGPRPRFLAIKCESEPSVQQHWMPNGFPDGQGPGSPGALCFLMPLGSLPWPRSASFWKAASEEAAHLRDVESSHLTEELGVAVDQLSAATVVSKLSWVTNLDCRMHWICCRSQPLAPDL